MSTTVPPTKTVVSTQLFSGEACHTGMHTSIRSSAAKGMLETMFGAIALTARCVRTHPLGAPVEPEV